MIKQGMVRLVLVAALVCLVGVGVRAQDVANDTNTTNLRTVSTSLGAPAAAPAKPARPSPFSMGSGVTFFVGYSYLNTGFPQGSTNDFCEMCEGRSGVHGVNAAATFMFNDNFGFTVDVSTHHGSPTQGFTDGCDGVGCTDDLDQDYTHVLFGPHVQKSIGKVNVFAHGLVGLERAHAANTTIFCPPASCIESFAVGPDTGFAVAVGGGADYMFSSRWGLRLFQLDYIFSSHNMDPGDFGDRGHTNDVRLSAGFVFHVGGGK